MTKSIILLFGVLLISSCGKNAFLNNATRSITAVEVDDRTISIELSEKFVDFEVLSPNQEKTKIITITNNGQIDLNSLVAEGNDNFSIDLSSCQNLKINQECLSTLVFSSSDLDSGIYNNQVEINLNESTKSVYLEYKAEIFNEGTSDGSLIAEYLDNKKVNFGTTYLGSSYKKLVYLSSTNEVKVRSFNVSDFDNSALNFYNGNLKCSQTITDDCFVELTFNPKKIGKYKSKAYISYFDIIERSGHTLVIDIVANVKKHDKCYDFKQLVHLPKNKNDLNQYELSLAYPYYTSSEATSKTLESVLNDAFTREMDIYDEIFRYNENTQVFFSYDVRRKDESIFSAKLLLDLLKYEDVKNDSLDTEILCNLDYQYCSGKRFIDRQFGPLKNCDYKMLNNQFSKDIVHANKSIEKGLKFYDLKSSFHLGKYLRMRESKIEKLADQNESMSFVVADDTKLQRNPLLITSRRYLRTCN